MTEPLTFRVVVHRDNGDTTDVTEGVRCLYDMVVQSMDWGSNFYSVEETVDVLRVAQACGFIVPEEARAAFESYAKHDATVYLPRPQGYVGKPLPELVKCGQWIHYQQLSRGYTGVTGWVHNVAAEHDPILWTEETP